MKLIHLADLHLGKKVFGYDLTEEQRDALNQVLQAADVHQVEGILICGDIYDAAVPPVEAVRLLSWFLQELRKRNLPVFLISGNHDSPSRLGFGAGLFEDSGIHMVTEYDGTVPFFDLSPKNPHEKAVRIHMLPFITPSKVRQALNASCTGWSEAAALALSQAQMDDDKINILLSHQYYAGAAGCESEQISIGGLDQIHPGVLDPFDYCALGHLHTPQSVRRDAVRYAGTLLKFSASELNTKKSITIVETKENPAVQIHELALHPKRDFVRIQGTFEKLISEAFRRTQNPDHYFYIVLDDKQEIFQVFEKLRTYYPRILKVEYASRTAQTLPEPQEYPQERMKKPDEIFEEFYEKQNGRPLDPSMKDLLEKLWRSLSDETD